MYPGAGWDDRFLQLKVFGYNKFLLYDRMPGIPYYEPNQCGWKKEQKFVEILKKKYGDYQIISPNVLFFPKDSIEYHISVDTDTIEPPKGDILLKGYIPKTWRPYFKNRSIIMACNRYTVNLYGDKILRFCFKSNHCTCDDSDAESELETEI